MSCSNTTRGTQLAREHVMPTGSAEKAETVLEKAVKKENEKKQVIRLALPWEFLKP